MAERGPASERGDATGHARASHSFAIPKAKKADSKGREREFAAKFRQQVIRILLGTRTEKILKFGNFQIVVQLIVVLVSL